MSIAYQAEAVTSNFRLLASSETENVVGFSVSDAGRQNVRRYRFDKIQNSLERLSSCPVHDIVFKHPSVAIGDGGGSNQQ